jgi:hypothetical protein
MNVISENTAVEQTTDCELLTIEWRVRPRRHAMPVYVAFRGPGADAQIQEEGCFIIDDEQGRRWFCRATERPDPSQPGFAEEFFRMAYLARKFGPKEGGQMFHGTAESPEDLRELLNEQ